MFISHSPVASMAGGCSAGVAAVGGSGSPLSIKSAGGWSPTGARLPDGAGATRVATDVTGWTVGSVNKQTN